MEIYLNRRNYSENERWEIFSKTGGHCYICGKKLVFKNRRTGLRGAWNIEHRYPYARGGTDGEGNNFRNLWPACIDCNQDKRDLRPSEHRGFEIPLGDLKYRWRK